MEEYIRVFEPYRETYRANNEHMTKVKEAYADSSLEEFRNTVDKYKGMTEDFEAIPARATVRPPKSSHKPGGLYILAGVLVKHRALSALGGCF